MSRARLSLVTSLIVASLSQFASATPPSQEYSYYGGQPPSWQAGGRSERRSGPLRAAGPAAQLGLGFLLAWSFFFAVGEILPSLPDSFHEGSRFPGASVAP